MTEGATIDYAGIATLAGVRKRTVRWWRAHYPDFPEPIQEPGMGVTDRPLWDEAAIRDWLAKEPRKVGRPPNRRPLDV